MLEATNQPQAFYTKNPTQGLGSSSGFGTPTPNPATGPATPPQATTPNPIQPKKKNSRTVLALVALLLFAAVASVGVFISLRQQEVAGPQAPTAPASKPAASEIKSPTCTIEWEVGPNASPVPSPTPLPSPSPSPSVSPSPSPSPSPSVSPSPSPSPTIYACGTSCTTDAQCETIDSNHYCHPTLRTCRLESNPTDTQCKPATSPTPSPSPSPSPVVYSCNSSCSSDAQCQTANADYVCDASAGNKCRLDSNRTNTSCEPAVATYSCNSACSTDAQCATANSNYICYSGSCRLSSNPTAENCKAVTYTPPAPAVGCNEVCSTNADCSNSDHICYTTADGTNRCRLANYVNSDTCTAPQVAYNPPAAPQPSLPPELPKTGATDWINWMKAGLVTLGIGAALLLLL